MRDKTFNPDKNSEEESSDSFLAAADINDDDLNILSDENSINGDQFPARPRSPSRSPARSPGSNDGDTWTDMDDNPPNIPFSGNPKINIQVSDTDKPYDYFKKFFTDEIMEVVVRETNRRGQKMFDSSKTRSKRVKKWVDVTAVELEKFLALCSLSGTVQFPILARQWSKDPLYFHPIFGKTMSRNRFTTILKNLRFVDHETVDKSERLYKIKPIIDIVLHNLKTLLSPEKQLSIDESMLHWRGRLKFKQYISNKRHKYGIKFYVLTTSDGYVLNFIIYTGKGTLNGENEKGHAFSVVNQLMADYLDKGHELYVDNFYNSVALAEYLIKKNTYIIGTLKENRKGNPKELLKKKLKKGEAAFKRKGPVLVVNWKDKRNVRMISTKHRHAMVENTNKRGNKKIKPQCILDYNRYMSGIDKSDQMMSYYSTPRKTIRWYRKIFFHLFDICLWNSFYAYKKIKQLPKVRLLKFREEVLRQMLKISHLDNTDIGQDTKNKSFHYLQPAPATEKEKSAMKRCRQCTKEKQNRKTRYFCPICPENPGLCVYPCFKNWHETQDV